ncbi:MAG: iron-containing alcohol dehydrogenase [Gammaproteobacteria bacterium]|nr:iron-containing alcohol dehydrogenase [Gammaproteobacteria bacterium]
MDGLSFQSVKTTLVQSGAVLQLPDLLCERALSRPLFVTDAMLIELGVVSPAIDRLCEGCDSVTVFDGIEPDPSERVVGECLAAFKSGDCDCVIAVGGGSSMDVAKVVSVLANNQQSLSEIYGVGMVSSPRMPLFLAPTTAGTGSEVTPVAIITTGETTKAGVSSPVLLPDVAILDAALTVGLPASITAMTGIDAMVHAIEAYTSKIKKNPISDMLALSALKLLSENIRAVLASPEDMTAREAMLLGSMFAGQAFANAPVGAVHALAYPVGGHYHIPHGLSNSLMLPSVLNFNAEACPALYAELAAVLPGAESSALGLIDWFKTLITESGLPTTLAQANIPESDLPMLASDAMFQQRLLINNPREVDEATALRLYREAWSGWA